MDVKKAEKWLDAEMQFVIGDEVVRRTDLAWARAEAEVGSLPRRADGCFGVLPPALVLERYLQECYGGVQEMYLVSRDVKGETKHERLMAPELAPYRDAIEVVFDFARKEHER